MLNLLKFLFDKKKIVQPNSDAMVRESSELWPHNVEFVKFGKYSRPPKHKKALMRKKSQTGRQHLNAEYRTH